MTRPSLEDISVFVMLACVLGVLVGCPPAEPEAMRVVGGGARKNFESIAADVPLIDWENVAGAPNTIYRSRTPGGWLLMVDTHKGTALGYVPDPEGKWLKPTPEVPK